MGQATFFKGKDIMVYVNGVPVGCDKTATLEITTKTADVTSKCSTDGLGNLWDETVAISNGWKISGNGLTVLDAGASSVNEYSTGKLMDLQMQQKKVYVTWVRGLRLYGGDAWVTSMKETSDAQNVSTYDYVLDGTGPINESAVS